MRLHTGKEQLCVPKHPRSGAPLLYPAPTFHRCRTHDPAAPRATHTLNTHTQTHTELIHIHSGFWCKNVNVQYRGACQSHASKAQLKTLSYCMYVDVRMERSNWTSRTCFCPFENRVLLTYDTRKAKGGNVFHRNCSLTATVYVMRICCILLFCYFLIPCSSALGLRPHKFIHNHVTDLILCLKEWLASKLPLLAAEVNCNSITLCYFPWRDKNFTPFNNAFKWPESAKLIFLGSVV